MSISPSACLYTYMSHAFFISAYADVPPSVFYRGRQTPGAWQGLCRGLALLKAGLSAVAAVLTELRLKHDKLRGQSPEGTFQTRRRSAGLTIVHMPVDLSLPSMESLSIVDICRNMYAYLYSGLHTACQSS